MSPQAKITTRARDIRNDREAHGIAPIWLNLSLAGILISQAPCRDLVAQSILGSHRSKTYCVMYLFHLSSNLGSLTVSRT